LAVLLSQKLEIYTQWCRLFYLYEQESCAIAKTTARCALYIAALKIFESHWLRPSRLLFPIF